MIARNFAPSLELEMARKDVRLMVETAHDRPLSALPGIAARMDSLIASGYGADDLAASAAHRCSGSRRARSRAHATTIGYRSLIRWRDLSELLTIASRERPGQHSEMIDEYR